MADGSKMGATEQWASLLSEAASCPMPARYRSLLRRARSLEAEEGLPAGLTPVSLALLGGATTDMLEGPLWLALLAAGLEPRIHVAPYNLFLHEMLDAQSGTSTFSPRIAVVINTPYNIPSWPDPGCDAKQADALAREVAKHFLGAATSLHERCGSEVVLCTFHSLPARPLGNLGAKLPDDPNNFIQRVNLWLGDLAPACVHLSDVAALAGRHGLDQWFDPRLWHQAKQPVSPPLVPELARNTAAIVAAALGRTRKCLVVDLDNTLWGGVIGDDGLEGIELGEGDARGEAFKAFQHHLKALQRRGVLLAVSSKNEEAAALLPFEKHPETVLRREDFVAFQANWRPKSENLREIAAELDLGLDSLVFLDDNPAEREEVRQALPQVLVLEVSDDPVDFPDAIDRSRCFEVTSVTEEDRQRSEAYRGRSQARKLQASAVDLSQYLQSLEMRAQSRPFEAVSLPRITQLINKTNQFNLTTRRLTRAQVEEIAGDSSYLTRSLRLSDRFGDHGLISVLIGRIDGSVLRIEDWLMSCRVLKRGVERLLLNEVVSCAQQAGVGEICGEFVASGRNQLVRDHYLELGFEPLEVTEAGATYRLGLEDFQPLDTFISLEETGSES